MKILVLGDVHAPYEHKKALQWAYRIADELKPTHVVQVGDLKDQFSFSRYPKVHKMDPEEELTRARAVAEKMWSHFKGLSCYQLCGNHDDRALKKTLAAAPELACLVGRSLRELYTFPGVKTIHDGREELLINGIVFQHGHRAKLGMHARYNQQSTVCGHSHTGGVAFMRNAKGVYWELNAGFLGDVHSPAFNYHAQARMHTTTLGVGLIDEIGGSQVPMFIPYPHAK